MFKKAYIYFLIIRDLQRWNFIVTFLSVVKQSSLAQISQLEFCEGTLFYICVNMLMVLCDDIFIYGIVI